MSGWSPPPPYPSGYPTLSLQSLNFPDRFIRHQNFLGELTAIVSDLDKGDASFYNEFGLYRQSPVDLETISLRSINHPTYYLRHQDFRIKLQEPPASGPNSPEGQLFAQDATFVRFWGFVAHAFTFRSVNFPDRYIRHRDFHLYLEPIGDPLLDFGFAALQSFVAAGNP